MEHDKDVLAPTEDFIMTYSLKILGLATLLIVTPALAQATGPAAAPARAARLSFAEKMAKAETDLNLTATQKPLWDAYVDERKADYAAHRSQPALDLPAWLEQQQKQYAGEAQALAPLWASLTVAQRQIADTDLMPHRRGKKPRDVTAADASPAPAAVAAPTAN